MTAGAGAVARWSSVEVRWFGEGALPPGVDAWFSGRGGAVAAPWRDDIYLVLPGQVELGLKRRGGGDDGPGPIEFKGRVAFVGERSFGPGIAGRVERWLKWSYAPAATPTSPLAALFDVDGTLTVVRVRKQRRIRAVRLGALGTPTRLPPSASRVDLDRGVVFELTRLEVEGRPSWTLGLEAFPDDEPVRHAFDAVVSGLLVDWPGPDLGPTTSASYPDWLNRRLQFDGIPPARDPRTLG